MSDDPTASPFYGEPLAEAHSDGFASHWDDAADWLADLARQTSSPPCVVDIGCGDGRMLQALAEKGVTGCGFDISAAFVDRARKRGLDVQVCDAANLAIPDATLIIALGEVLCYLGPSGATPFEHVVRQAAEKLRPGGALVFDVLGPEVPSGSAWREGEGWVVASRSRVGNNILEREIITFTRHEDHWRRDDEVHRQRLYDRRSVTAGLAAAGFDVEELTTIGGVNLLPGRLAFLAKKP